LFFELYFCAVVVVVVAGRKRMEAEMMDSLGLLLELGLQQQQR